MPERDAYYVNADAWTCPECGSTAVEEQVWREVNTGETTGEAGDEYYCGNGCEAIPFLVEPGLTRDHVECSACRGTRTVLVTVYGDDGESDYEAPCTRCV